MEMNVLFVLRNSKNTVASFILLLDRLKNRIDFSVKHARAEGTALSATEKQQTSAVIFSHDSAVCIFSPLCFILCDSNFKPWTLRLRPGSFLIQKGC